MISGPVGMWSGDGKTSSQNLHLIFVSILGLTFSWFQAKDFKLLVFSHLLPRNASPQSHQLRTTRPDRHAGAAGQAGLPVWLRWVSCCTLSHKAAIRMPARMGRVHPEGWPRRICFQMHVTVSGLQSLAGSRNESPFLDGCYLALSLHCGSLPMAASWFQSQKDFC